MSSVQQLKAKHWFNEQRQEGEREYRRLGLAEGIESASIQREKELAAENVRLAEIINEAVAAERRLAMH